MELGLKPRFQGGSTVPCINQCPTSGVTYLISLLQLVEIHHHLKGNQGSKNLCFAKRFAHSKWHNQNSKANLSFDILSFSLLSTLSVLYGVSTNHRRYCRAHGRGAACVSVDWMHVKWREVKVTQSCPTLCDPKDYTVHGILQARILERTALICCCPIYSTSFLLMDIWVVFPLLLLCTNSAVRTNFTFVSFYICQDVIS